MNPPPLDSRRKLLEWTINILREHGIRPRRSLSQNFLIEPRVIRDIVSSIEPYDRLLEVGAGIGTLTYYVSRRTRRYSIHFEIDQRLAEIAVEAVGERGVLVNGDVMLHEWRIEEVVGTIPYHITSPILVKIAHTNDVRRAILVIQKDVVDRLKAEPGTRDYGRLTVLIQLLFDIWVGGVYDPSSFYPSPEVYSQLIVLVRKRNYDDEIRGLEELTRRIFNMRRRRLVKVLRDVFGIDGEWVVRRLGLGSDVRVYMVDPGVLLRLTRLLRDIGLI